VGGGEGWGSVSGTFLKKPGKCPKDQENIVSGINGARLSRGAWRVVIGDHTSRVQL